MLGIHLSIICNKLVIYPQAKLVLQKKRKMGEELRKVVREEIDKLLKAQFIMEIRYSTWLPNVVMVKFSPRMHIPCLASTSSWMACSASNC